MFDWITGFLERTGTLSWTALLAAAGYLLREQYGRVATVLDPVTSAALLLVLAWYAWRVATFGRRHGG